jgi:hypothetical protein
MSLPGSHHAAYHIGRCFVTVVQEGDDRWHMAISMRNRVPTWDEMKYAARKVLPQDLYYVLCFPPDRDWMSVHPHCLHLIQTRDQWLIDQMKFEGGMVLTL